MSSVKERLLKKIKMIKGFEDADINNIHPQSSKKNS